MLSLLVNVAVSLKVGEFVGAAMAILEGIAQHPTLLMEHQTVVIETVLPELVSMVGSQTGKKTVHHKLKFNAEMDMVQTWVTLCVWPIQITVLYLLFLIYCYFYILLCLWSFGHSVVWSILIKIGQFQLSEK